MKIIKAGYEILTPINAEYILAFIEGCGRVCYKSEDKIEDGTAEKFVAHIIKRHHEAVLEHFGITVKFICDRGVSHELVRHRVASFCQESTRYCNYSKGKFGNEITVIQPFEPNENDFAFETWFNACKAAEKAYFSMLEDGCTPQSARNVLPTSLKTEVVMTANIREWRHFFNLRCSEAAHPQMREIAIPLLKELQAKIPVLFDDITV